MQNVKSEQEVIKLSKEKWRWMSERKVDSLAAGYINNSFALIPSKTLSNFLYPFSAPLIFLSYHTGYEN